jgi:hypothetical protein
MRHAGSLSGGSNHLRREQVRLRRIFTTLVFAVAPAALAQACSSTATAPHGDAGPGAEAGVDASFEGGTGFEGGADAGLVGGADSDAEA